MKVLIGCEFSGVVRDAFRKRGHDAWSCDLLPSDRPGKHLQDDVVLALYKIKWDLIILHPPCTKIALCGNRHYGRGTPGYDQRVRALYWTQALWKLAIMRDAKVALENPKNVLGSKIGKHTQSIQPYEFGHMEQKDTWLWLHNLPKLTPTNNVYEKMMTLPKKKRERIHYMSPSKDRGHLRSITFQGIANAMADQWGSL